MNQAVSHFIILDSVDSTNNYAMAMVHEGLAKHGNAYFSPDQTHGKGQWGKAWHSAKGLNLALSVVVEPHHLHISEQFHLSVAVALGCFDFFSQCAGPETSIKWPNDIYWRDRKAGGILIENVFKGTEWKFSVIGIGININQTQFDPLLKHPVSLKQITGKHFDLVKLATELHQHVLRRFAILEESSFPEMLLEYNQLLFCLNKPVRLKKGAIIFETVIKEVSGMGKLITVDSMDRVFEYGEVEWVR